jgi:hypothetical protein
MALQYISDRNGWLSFRASTPILYITAEDEEFDIETMQAWRDEGFMVKYIPMNKGGKQYVQTLYGLGDACGIGERYAIVGKQALDTSVRASAAADTSQYHHRGIR